MAIQILEEKKLFTLHTKNTSYQFMIDQYGVPLHLYYGKKIQGDASYLLTYYDRGFSGNPYDAGNDRAYSYDALPLEYPTSGIGDYRSPAIRITDNEGTECCDFRFHSYEKRNGKYALRGLPSVYVEQEEEAESLEIILEDAVLSARLHLLYGVLEEKDIITRAVYVENLTGEVFYVDKLLSGSMDFLSGDFDLITFHGRHAMERNMQRTAVTHNAQHITSRRGATSHQMNNSMILLSHDATEETGDCYSLNLVYSGGFTGMCEKDAYQSTRIQLGIMEEKLHYPVKSGESFYSAELILSYAEGLDRLSQNLHACIRENIVRGEWRDKLRPVLLNSWEAFYMSFTGEDILGLARDAKKLGMDMLVLDDGWFGKRDDDNSGLGDWFVNEEKLGSSLSKLVDEVHGLGLQFGLWFEPEMVNEDSQLYREHPDYALSIPGRKPTRGRNQLVLDFSRKEVVDCIYNQVDTILKSTNIDYIKWDFNRSIADVYSHSEKLSGTVLYDFVLGLYDFLERLHVNYPQILIEGCSGGGGRFDAGMLYYTPQIWLSDNTDAIDRLRIQYGSSFIYPISTMGAHVSKSPNEQNGRVTPLETRAIVAMCGGFGYELDPSEMTEEEQRELPKITERYKKYQELIQKGSYHRLSSPFTDDYAAWAFVSAERTEALLNVVVLESRGNRTQSYVKLRNLLPNRNYVDEETGQVYDSNLLMSVGLPIPIEFGEYRSYQWKLNLL